jgi:beta-barrel assembly-enhancing protease
MKLLAAALVGVTLISVPEEVELGREANAKVRRELVEFRDPAITAYVRSLGSRLVRSARGPKYPYTFATADYREINAFALPGGPIWINRGVLHAATNESQVAGVVAHEIAHIAQRHAARQVTNGAFANWGLGLLGALLGNSGGAAAARTAAGAMTNGIFLKFSRDDEREADRVGLQILTRAGWDGRGIVELFEVLQRAQKRDPDAVEVFFSTHPPPAERIRQLKAGARRSGGRRDSSAFRQIKARSLKLSPPRRMQR